MKHIFLTITLLSISVVLGFSQQKRVVDKKIHISRNTIIELSKNKIEKENKTSVSDIRTLSQLTNDETSDLELHAAINPTDTTNIIISWMKMDISNTSMPLVFKALYTLDFGETWNESSIDFIPRPTQSNEAVSGGGDPMIVFDNNGAAYISWIYTIVRVISSEEIYIDVYLTYAKSTDKGATWIRPEGGDDFISSGIIDYELGSGITGINTGNFPDKQWMCINPVNNDLFVSLAEFNTTDNFNTGIDTWGIRRKPAASTHFDDKVLVPPVGTVWAQLGSMAIDKNGNIHAVYPYYPTFPDPPLEKLMHSVSTDDGVNYSSPHFIDDVNVTYFTGVDQENTTSTSMYDRLYPCSYIAIDTSSTSLYENRIYTVWNSGDANYNKKVDVLFSYSNDNGTTWSNPQIINSDPPRDYGFHHHPTIYINPNGVIVLGWYDNRGYEIPNVYMNDYYVAISTDGGENFSEQKITSTPFNYNDDNFDSSVGIGEYFQILASENHILAFYAYFDDNDTEIYFNKLAFGDEVSIPEISPVTEKISVKEIYPNPTDNYLNLKIESKSKTEISYSIFSVQGFLIKKYSENKINTGQNNLSIDIKELPCNIYFIKIDTEYGSFIKKFIKN